MSFPQIFTDILASHFSMARAAKRSYFTLRNFLVALPDCDRRSPIALMSGSRRPDWTDRTDQTGHKKKRRFLCISLAPLPRMALFFLHESNKRVTFSKSAVRTVKGGVKLFSLLGCVPPAPSKHRSDYPARKKSDLEGQNCYLDPSATETRTSSATGTRTRVARVRAEYPNQLDYSGL